MRKVKNFLFIVAISMFVIVSCSGGNKDGNEESVSLDPVNIPVAGVSLNRTNLSIPQNGTVQLTATVSNPNSTNRDVSWIINDNSVATVSSTGLVTGKDTIGSTTTITVTTVDGNFTANCIVKVTDKNLPIITTLPIKGDLIYTKSINGTSAKGGCILEYNGTTTVTERGLCWKINGSPTTADNKVSNGISRGEFVDFSLINLTVDKKYCVKAYATNSSGTVYGDEISFNSGKSFGTDCAGGYIFYNDGNGFALLSAKSDQTTSQMWISGGTTIITLNGSTSQLCGSGQANTTAIIGQQDHTGSAAQICNDYSDGTSSHWYLPSKDELNLMYENLKLNSLGGFTNSYYWSSSEYDAKIAWGQSFENGSRNNITKSYTFSIRAIRTLNISEALPTVNTTDVKGNLSFTKFIAGISAKGGGNVTDQGGSAVTERGLCWNSIENPTINDSHATDGSGMGEFSSSVINGLVEDTVYYVRAYATNSNGTIYGNQISFNSGKTFGTVHAGGFVFYNNGDGGGLVCVKDQNPLSISQTYAWSDVIDVKVNETEINVGTGKANTIKIINQSGHTNGAAKICSDYNDSNYSDWFLPSYHELKLMLIRLDNVGGFLGWYWSSSEQNSTDALALTNSTVNDLEYSKTLEGWVRPVREF